MLKLLKYISFFLLATLALPVSAQFLGTEQEPIRVSISPQVPVPGGTVRLEVQGIGTFLGDATITWRKDGAVAATDLGERIYSFTAGPLGTLTRIDLEVNSPTQGVITRSFSFVPSTINLVWEADTSVPPLYRGKALYSPGSTVRVTAFPQVVAGSNALSAASLSYQWKRGGENQSAQSGKGRRTFTYTGNQLQSSETISVDVYLDTVLVGQSSIVIAATKPQMVLYERDPLRGVLWSEGLPAAVSLNAREITLQAVPYYFANDSLASDDLEFKWELNGRSTSGPGSDQGLMTLRQTGEGTGQAILGVKMQNTRGTRLLQSAEAVVRLVFGVQTPAGASSFFGL